MIEKVWIVTAEVNDYGQYGQYFVGCFVNKPTFKDLKPLLPRESDPTIGKLTRGGGRQDVEDTWYHLTEVECGSLFEKFFDGGRN